MASPTEINNAITRGNLLFAQYVGDDISAIFKGKPFFNDLLYRMYFLLESLEFKVSEADYGDTTQSLYTRLMLIIGSVVPTPPNVTVQWGYFSTNPYGDIINNIPLTYQFSSEVPNNTAGLHIVYDQNSSSKYLVIKVPLPIVQMDSWSSSVFNYGVFPDQVFIYPVSMNSSIYYISRIPVILDISNPVIELFNA